MFKRGFKAWCETVSLQFRKELKVDAIDPLPPRVLATHLNVLIWYPEQIPGFDQAIANRLATQHGDYWSAVTLQVSTTSLILVNVSHSHARQASSIMHELAHLILKHEAQRVDVSAMGHLLLSSYDKEQEMEADWLGATLLVPRAALLVLARRNLPTTEAAKKYGVSVDLLEWRRNVTGVDIQLRNRRAGAVLP